MVVWIWPGPAQFFDGGLGPAVRSRMPGAFRELLGHSADIGSLEAEMLDEFWIDDSEGSTLGSPTSGSCQLIRPVVLKMLDELAGVDLVERLPRHTFPPDMTKLCDPVSTRA